MVPMVLEEAAKEALSHYPELQNTPIAIRFKEHIKRSTMQAQPVLATLWKSGTKRRYQILVSKQFKIAGEEYRTIDIPKNVMVGWLGHELGHIMDYCHRNAFNMMGFGLKYLFSSSYIKKAERAADTIAVHHGMERYILDTKDFILNRAGISEVYRERIKKYYLSPEEIMKLVEERDLVQPLSKSPIRSK